MDKWIYFAGHMDLFVRNIHLLLVVFLFGVFSSYAQDLRMISECNTMIVDSFVFNTEATAQDFADRYAFTFIEEYKTPLVGETLDRVARNISNRRTTVRLTTTHRSDRARNIREGDYIVEVMVDITLGYTMICLTAFNPNRLPSLSRVFRVIGIFPN